MIAFNYLPVKPNIPVAAFLEEESFLNIYGLFVDKLWSKSVDAHHNHDYFQLYYTISGSYKHTINGVTKICTPGDVSLIMPYTVHHLDTLDTNIEETTLITISFLPRLFPQKNIPLYPISFENAAFREKLLPSSMMLSGEDKVFADKLMLDIHSEFQKHSDMFITSILKKLMSFFDICHKSSGLTVKGTSLPARISSAEQVYKAARYVNENRTKKLTIEELSAISTMSRSTFTKNFRSVMGMSFHDLLLEIRLSKAVTELRYSHKSIAEIAEEVGFSSSSHFIRACTATYSRTPLALKKEMAERTREYSRKNIKQNRRNDWARIRASELQKEHYRASIGETY